MTTPPPNAGKPVAPAPAKVEEEDLDELDDLLDQFTPAPAPVPPTTSKPTPPPASTSATKDSPATEAFPDDFEAALAREMEAMMRGEPTESTGSNDMAAAWQKLLIGDLEGTNPQEDMSDLFKNLGVGAGSGADTDTNPDDAFQRTIRQAMDKLKTSDENAKASGSTDDFAELLKQLGEGGGEGEEGLQGMIENMMGQLMSKEILYEPLVEMNEKFPGYFTEHPNLPEAELKRYKSQEAIVKQLVEIYQKPDYSDDNTETNKEVLRLMNEMQELGSPPTEIMGEVPPGFDFNSPEGMAQMLDKDGCVIA
ncbi:unnamed protein product [Rhizoctonia solani]|uniref:Peroxisome biogenesis protein 19-1 n=1 Tax=Rhizoctonia solani TaxID=456999 RepID=A0A8H2XG79_9AGAM|nr:unnamed protein product [Rhizoctonia solani]